MYICWIKARTKIKNAVFRRCFCVRSTPLIIWIKSVSKKHFIKKFTIKNLDLLVSVISFSTRPCSLTAAAHLEQTTRTHWWFWQKDDPCFHTITWRCYKNCSIKEYAEEEEKTLQGRPKCIKTFIWAIIDSLAFIKSKIRRKRSEYLSKIVKYWKENEAMTRKRRAISEPQDFWDVLLNKMRKYDEMK